MNPQNNEQFPRVDLPPPLGAPDSMPSKREAQVSQGLEQGYSTASPFVQPPSSTSSTIPDDRQLISTDPMALQAMASNSATPAIADDSDLIEKEWVAKAKEIVARTKDDPYLQSKEINKVRADYLKKRYNKDLKPSED